MRINVVGLGHVGTVIAACWADQGFEVIGVDVDASKVAMLNEGESPIVEPSVSELVASGVASSRLRATTDLAEAVALSDVSMVCVGTPSQRNGSPDLRFVERVSRELGRALRDESGFHLVVMRSTVLPGTNRCLVIPCLEEASFMKHGKDFGLVSNPEFLREGSAVLDFLKPPKTVIGETESRSGDLLASLYAFTDAPLVRVGLETAEMIKFADNAWHANKVTFANEIGNIAKELGVDGTDVMEVLCRDTKLNISPAYLRPGFAFGGSCLPKDVRALCYQSRSLELPSPLLNSLLPSNACQIDRALEMIRADGRRRIGMFGLSFKAETDDLRESPQVELVERLIGKGYDIAIYDRNVNLVRLRGANREHILSRLPHVASLIRDDMLNVVHCSDVLVVATSEPEFENLPALADEQQTIVDLVHLGESKTAGNYKGICW